MTEFERDTLDCVVGQGEAVDLRDAAQAMLDAYDRWAFNDEPNALRKALAKLASSHARDVVRCLATGNPVGTDTWQVGRPCRCANCSSLSQSTSAGRVE